MKRTIYILLVAIAVAISMSALTSCGTVPDTLGVTSVTPNAGSTVGGTIVTIKGRKFTATTRVYFGASLAHPNSFDSTGQLTVISPAGSAGKVNVTIENDDGSTTTKSEAYTYKSILASANSISNDISLFDIDMTNDVVSRLSTNPSGGRVPLGLAFDVGGSLLFATNGNSSTVSSSIFSMQDGSLTQVEGSPFDNQGVGPVFVVSDTAEDIIVTVNNTYGNLSSFTYDPATGVLTFVENDGSDGAKPDYAVIDEEYNFLFIADSSSSTIAVFGYDGEGVLTEIGTPVGAQGIKPIALAIDTSSMLLFVANFDSSTVTTFSYNENGTLRFIGSYAVSGNSPRDLALDTTLNLVFIANYGSNTVRSYSYDEYGTIDTSSGYTLDAGGQNPISLAIDTSDLMLFVANYGSSTILTSTYDADGLMTAPTRAVDAGGTGVARIVFIP